MAIRNYFSGEQGSRWQESAMKMITLGSWQDRQLQGMDMLLLGSREQNRPWVLPLLPTAAHAGLGLALAFE